MAIQRKSRAFKDISLSFSPHPVTKDLPVLTNERAIVRSVRNLVETIPSERFFESLLGTEENYFWKTAKERKKTEDRKPFDPKLG